MKHSLLTALCVLTLAWASPAWSAQTRAGEAELLGAEIQASDGQLVARGVATLRDGTLYLRADTIAVTVDAAQQPQAIAATGGARASLGALYIVADTIQVDVGTRSVSARGAVAVYRGATNVHGDSADVLADGPWGRAQIPSMSVVVRPAQGQVQLPTRERE